MCGAGGTLTPTHPYIVSPQGQHGQREAECSPVPAAALQGLA